MQIAHGMENARHLCLGRLSGYWTVHSMTISFTIESCLKLCLEVTVMPGFRAYASVQHEHYLAKRRSFQ
jgi:hypothetical protein